MKKSASFIICCTFLGFIALFFVLNLVIPDRDFSPQENRSLQQNPTFSVESLVSGEYMADFESYCSDQFVLRDRWISLKARMELLLGKSENNGVFLCENQHLLEPFSAPSSSDLDSRIYAINSLVNNLSVPVHVALIPSAAEIYRDLLPVGIENDSQIQVIDYVYNGVTANSIDIASSLLKHSNEYIFYRTDHHWTSLGAYYGFKALSESMGLSIPELHEYEERRTVTDDFLGTTYSTSGFAWVKPDSMEIFREQPEGTVIQRYESPTGEVIPLYDFDQLTVKDKYSFYLGGNTPRLVIDTKAENKPILLIIRDSYCDSLTPFLLDQFSQIHILDLRYYRDSITSYVTENHIDQVLVIYSVNNFSTDRNLVLLSR